VAENAASGLLPSDWPGRSGTLLPARVKPSVLVKSFACFLLILAAALPLPGGESVLTTTFQPLDGLGSGTIVIVPVTCRNWHGMSGQPARIGLIAAPNVLPGNAPAEAAADLNLASVCGLRFACSDVEAARELTLDATAFAMPTRFVHRRDHIIRACLECLRRCLPDALRDTPVVLKRSAADAEWIDPIMKEFNVHDRRRVFFTPES